ncbi:MAG: hypothetical protein ACFNQI_08925, partial [Eikenella corrodens]
EGMIPFCNIYSSFLQRAYDQVIHDAANTYLMFHRFRLMSGAADADEYEMEIRRLKGYLKTQEDKVHWQEFLAAWR